MNSSKESPLLQHDFCFLDIETTGLESEKDSIIEVSFVCIDHGKETDIFDEVFLPNKTPITPFVSQLTGITEKEVCEKNQSFEKFREKIREKIGHRTIVGHNIRFDIDFLIANGVDIVKNPHLDTHHLARILMVNEESYALEVLSHKYGLHHTNAHRAMSDVRACQGLCDILLKRGNSLPQNYLQSIQPLKEKNPHWSGWCFFVSESECIKKEDKEKTKEAKTPLLKTEIKEKFRENFSQSFRVHFNHFEKSLQAICEIAEDTRKTKKVLIVSPRYQCFESHGFSFFPAPEILIDTTKVAKWAKKNIAHEERELVFLLKCYLRQLLGHRGKRFFDIFTYGESDLWERVCMQRKEEKFREILNEKSQENILVVDPYTFFRYQEEVIFTERLIIFDETEKCANALLLTKVITLDFEEIFCEKNEKKSQDALFSIQHIYNHYLKKHLGEDIGVFPKNIPLGNEIFAKISPELQKFFGKKAEKVILATKVKNNRDFFWAYYAPEHQSLSLKYWSWDDWQQAKNKLQNQSVIFFHRHHETQNNQYFWKNFLGHRPESAVIIPEVMHNTCYTLLQNPPSQYRQDLHTLLAKKFRENFTTHGKNTAMIFSSLATLRSVADELFTTQENETILGEKLKGGDGKLRSIFPRSENILFLHHRGILPFLQDKSWGQVIFQKFPFLPPDPIIDHLKSVYNTWETWTLPTIAANISLLASLYPDRQGLQIWDPKANAPWAKSLLYQGFGGNE